MKKPTVASRILQRLESFTESLEIGEPTPMRYTCRKVILDLRPETYDPKKVKETRALLGLSQGIFACLLGVSVKTIRSWEQGINQPQMIACRFMDEICRDPGYWRTRIVEAAASK